MIRFTDLLAARILNRERPDLRHTLLVGLDTLEEEGSERDLLATLVELTVIAPEEAQRVRAVVQQHERAHALELVGRVAEQEGVPKEELAELSEGLGPTGDALALGRALVAAGHVSAEEERALLRRAREQYDRDLAEQVEAYQSSRSESRQREGDDEVGSLSQVVTLPVVLESEGAPAFPIPDWIRKDDERVGEEVAGYRVLGRIGGGAMGAVFLADHPDEPERPVALKLLLDAEDEDARGRFQREILANALFSHEGILEVYDAGETDDGLPFLAMEFFDGENLAKLISASDLPLTEALRLARRVFEAAGAAHEAAGVVHRDIKPENILVSPDLQQIKLMDFGIAIIPSLDELGDVGTGVFKTMLGDLTPGTPRYMSVEQVEGESNLKASSDLYSLGLVLFELVAPGEFPFESESNLGYLNSKMMEDPRSLTDAAPELPPELHVLVDWLLAKKADDRPQEAGVVIEQLDSILASLEA